ncbi:MAG TPA: hypothetical protein VFQ53_07905 [Kofleriaceae bacterium]|nr:hypothetical protein [Kofleriaceae bacterium]
MNQANGQTPGSEPPTEPVTPEPASEKLEITFAGTCDLAMWCKLLRDKGWSGPRIARALGRSEGYVNNLIRVVDRASPAVMLRWRQEQGGATQPVCATDWLVQLCLLPHDQQNAELQRRIAAFADPI